MYCKLYPGIALRGWAKVPWAYYRWGERNARGLTEAEYELLSRCDGETALEDGPSLRVLIERKLALPCAPGDRPEDWQLPRFCANRYFPAVNWAVTGQCNFNCKHCFMARDDEPTQPEFTLDECMALLDDFVTCGIQTVCLNGGEPFLRSDLGDILRGIAQRNLYLEDIATNGSLVTPELLDLMKELGQHPVIKISFDGVTCHDWMRGTQGAEIQALGAISLCKTKGFPVMVQSCFHRGNIATLYDTALQMDSMGVDEMRIIRTAEAPRWVRNGAQLNLTAEEFYDACLEFLRLYRTAGRAMPVDIWSFATYWPSTGKYGYRPVECDLDGYRDSLPVCRGNRGMVFIGCDGAVAPCNQMSGVMRAFGEDWGNVKREGLQQLLLDSPYLDHAACTVGELFAHNPKCGGCQWRQLCLGGCRAIGYGITGDYLGEDYMKCAFFRGGYMEKLDRVLGRGETG